MKLGQLELISDNCIYAIYEKWISIFFRVNLDYASKRDR